VSSKGCFVFAFLSSLPPSLPSLPLFLSLYLYLSLSSFSTILFVYYIFIEYQNLENYFFKIISIKTVIIIIIIIIIIYIAPAVASVIVSIFAIYLIVYNTALQISTFFVRIRWHLVFPNGFFVLHTNLGSKTSHHVTFSKKKD